jgi:hypothetical protein
VSFTRESLGNIPAHRVDGIVGLALRLEIAGERPSLRELEDLACDRRICDVPMGMK